MAAPAAAARTASQRDAKARYDTRFIPFWFVGRVVQLAVWLGCLISFGIGTVGNIGIFGGDFTQALQGRTYFASTDFLIPLVPSVCYQFVIQCFQIYAARKCGQSSWQYRATLAFSVVPSCWTYGWAVVPWAWGVGAFLWGSVWIARLPTVGALLLAAIIVIVLNDVIQDWVLVKQEA